VLVAVTGTPGTGKSSVCDALARRGYHVVDLDAAAKDLGLTEAGEDGTVLVDVEALARRLHVPVKVAFLEDLSVENSLARVTPAFQAAIRLTSVSAS